MSLIGVGNVGGNASCLEIASQTRDKWKSASKNRDHRAAAFGKKGSEPPNADAASPMLKAVLNRPFSWRGYATEIQRFFADAQTSTDRKQMLNLRAAKSGSEPLFPDAALQTF